MNYTVLISAYSINPYRALDDGIAWNIVQALDQKFRLIVVTHSGNRKDIEMFLSSKPEAAAIQAQFEYYDPSFLAGSVKTHPPKTLIQKYRWHWGVVSFIRQRQLEFDLVHHLTFPCGWCPSFLWRFEQPFIWGPVGYSPPVALSFIRPYGWLAVLQDRLCWGIRRGLWFLDPFVRISARKAAHIFTINQEVEQALKLKGDRSTILWSIATHHPHKKEQADNTFKILCVGPFSPLSGFDLAIHAFVSFYDQLETVDQAQAELIIIGRGPAKRKLEQIAQATHLPPGKICIIESDDSYLIENSLSQAKIFFSPTHDHVNRLLPQALAHGLPVVCFDREETSSLVGDCCSLSISYGTYADSIVGFARHFQTLFQQRELRERLSQGARQKFERQLTWAARGDVIAEAYWNVYHRDALMRLAEGDLA